MTVHPSLALEKQERKVQPTPQPQIIREQVDLTPLIERLDSMEANIAKLHTSIKMIQITLGSHEAEDKEIMDLLIAKLKKKKS